MNDKVAIARVEQISPFPYDLIKREVEKYPNAEIMWTQEEAKNQGAWSYVQPRFVTALNGTRNLSNRSSHKNSDGWLSAWLSSSKPSKSESVPESPQKTKSRRIRYAGRACAASPATGSKMQHLKELKQFLDDSFDI